MKFDDQFIDQVRNSTSIVHLVGGYVRLKKSGKDYSALCPFHSEKTPSFLVSESKQIFKCFGCGAGGDIFRFIMLVENLNFPDAVQYLAERSGIPIPRSTKVDDSKTHDRTLLLKIMDLTTSFFQQRLSQCSGVDDALAYLRQRQIEPSTIERFKIGFAPPGNQLLTLLKNQGFGVDQLLACGLLKEASPDQYYDKFRNRIMFPIRDLSGKTIAFGGRILGEGLPKYLNSPETILYNKSSHLYALDQSREEIRQRDFAILVEGYFDCIVPFQFGFRNVAASLGTSLTQNQVKTLGRYTRNVIVNYDPDSAGLAATMRSIDLFLEQGFHVNILQLPSGQDPDTYLRSEGPLAYQERLKSCVPYLEFALSRLMEEQPDPLSPKGKQEIVSGILPYLLKVPNKIERAEYVSRIASRLWLDENLILSEMRKISTKTHRAIQQPISIVTQETTPAENALLVALFDQEHHSEALELLDPELFEGLRTQQIFSKVLELKKQNQEITIINLRKLLDEGEDLNLVEKAALRGSQFPLSGEIIRSSVRALQKKQYERVSQELQEEIKREEKQDSTSSRIGELVVKKQKIRRKIELDLS